jgi:beta-lactamase class A
MIGHSDNTATDHLITRLGRARVESAFAAFGNARPERDIPLLLTREWFAFKLRCSPAQVDAYLALDVDAKRTFLTETVEPLAATLTDQDDWVGSYLVEEIEWFASAADLCRVASTLLLQSANPALAPVRDALSLNPGIAFDARTWAYVGYKGGYETGVKSDVWLLQRGDGRWFVLAVVINDPRKEIHGIELWQYMVPLARLLAAVE